MAEYPLQILFSPQRKEHCGGIEPHLHKPHFPDMLLTMPLPVVLVVMTGADLRLEWKLIDEHGRRLSTAPMQSRASARTFITTEMTLARAEYFSTDCEYQGVQVPLPVVCPDLLITSQGRNAPDSLMRSWNTSLVFSR
ncbi:hypothetical protein R0E42_002329 [Klebsiella variicola]|nr:hypothetical protein [Klebsiella variicola]